MSSRIVNLRAVKSLPPGRAYFSRRENWGVGKAEEAIQMHLLEGEESVQRSVPKKREEW